jgi:hypothetical protein
MKAADARAFARNGSTDATHAAAHMAAPMFARISGARGLGGRAASATDFDQSERCFHNAAISSQGSAINSA